MSSELNENFYVFSALNFALNCYDRYEICAALLLSIEVKLKSFDDFRLESAIKIVFIYDL